jgi:hypothetical protein
MGAGMTDRKPVDAPKPEDAKQKRLERIGYAIMVVTFCGLWFFDDYILGLF